MAARATSPPPVVAIFGEEEYAKSTRLRETLNQLLPPEVDRGMALVEYDGSRPEDDGGPVLAAVMDDLRTLPFLAERRVVLIREADKFITAWRAKLESYCAAPSSTGTLILICRSLPKSTRLYKAIAAAGGQLHESARLRGREVAAFAIDQARTHGKRLPPPVAARLVELIGPAQGLLASEIEKLSLYVGSRPEISDNDVTELVGQTREERIFSAVDAAGAGRLREALAAWEDVLTTDPSAIYKALGGMAYVIRRWCAAHEMAAAGENIRAIAPKVQMWGRERDLEAILHRQPRTRCKLLLAAIADLDAQAKVGLRSIETGVAALLVQIAA